MGEEERVLSLRGSDADVFALGWGVQQATCTGYFKKENANTFGFTKRWFKLHGHVLLYYENEHKSKAKGVIDVSEATISITPVCFACQAYRAGAPAFVS